jgi:hypothetical protein
MYGLGKNRQEIESEHSIGLPFPVEIIANSENHFDYDAFYREYRWNLLLSS